MSEEGEAKVRVTIKGRVQGVGFRYWICGEARRLGLRGWVRNRPDGAVEALFAGPGARVEDTGIQPSVGALAILYVCLPDDPKPFQLEGKVTRHTDAGFAIEYEVEDPEVRRLVDDVSAIVSAVG